MKDLPHHMKKLNRRVIRSEQRIIESEFEETQNPQIQRPKEQIRKQVKSEMREVRLAHTPNPSTPETRNQEMKHRVPIFDRTSHPRPKQAGKSKKKTPPI